MVTQLIRKAISGALPTWRNCSSLTADSIFLRPSGGSGWNSMPTGCLIRVRIIRCAESSGLRLQELTVIGTAAVVTASAANEHTASLTCTRAAINSALFVFIKKDHLLQHPAMFNKNINEINRQAWLEANPRRCCPRVRASSMPGPVNSKTVNTAATCTMSRRTSASTKVRAGGAPDEGLQTQAGITSRIDLVSDITAIPAPDASFDAILCSEVLEHVPEPTHALDEFARLLKPGGKLILTAPFASFVHMAPYHYCNGFCRYWYEHHLPRGRLQHRATWSPTATGTPACRKSPASAAWNASVATGAGRWLTVTPVGRALFQTSRQ